MTAELMTMTRPVGPSGIELLPHDADQAEWLAMRNSGIGASEVAAIRGMSKYDTPYSLWARKTGRTSPGPVTAVQAFGLFAEDPIAAMFAANHPEFAVANVGLVRSAAASYELATPDRELLSGAEHAGLLEIKTSRFGHREDWGDDGSNEIPIAYLIQVQWQMAVCGSPLVWVAVIFDGDPDDYHEYLVHRDDDIIDVLLADVADFWRDHVLANEPPSIDGHDATTKALRALPSTGETVELPEEAATWRLDYWRGKALERQGKELAALAANAMRDEMHGGVIGTVGGQQLVTNKWQAGATRLDVEALMHDYPDLNLAAYQTRGAPYPVLRPRQLATGEAV